MYLKSLALGIVSFALVSASGAQASDLSEPLVEPRVGYNWSGVYGGVSAGGAWGDSKIRENLPTLGPFLPASISSKHDVDGFIGGVHLGMNRQFGNIVVGTEINFSGGNIDGSTGDCLGLTTLVGVPPVSFNCKSSVNWVASALFKAGYAWDRWLAYGMVGWAVAGVDHRFSLDIPIPVFPISLASAVNETADGWAFGGGLEYAFASGVSFGIEYTHINLEADGSGLVAGGIVTTGSRDIDLDIVKVRLNWKWNG